MLWARSVESVANAAAQGKRACWGVPFRKTEHEEALTGTTRRSMCRHAVNEPTNNLLLKFRYHTFSSFDRRLGYHDAAQLSIDARWMCGPVSHDAEDICADAASQMSAV